MWLPAIHCVVAGLMGVLGCDDDPGGAPDMGRLPCQVAADCSDGLFCNGEEACSPASSQADAFGCVQGTPPCEFACDDGLDQCLQSCPDVDGDGHARASCGGDDCDDDDAMRFPGNPEVCDAADRDEDCDATTVGSTDADGDGAVDAACCNGERCGADCDDTDGTVNPLATEACDGVDNDCDRNVDEGVLRYFWPDGDGDGYGALDAAPEQACLPSPGQVENTLDCDDDDGTINPTAGEPCNGVDDNCNGVIDDPAQSAISCTATFGSPPYTTMQCEAAQCEIESCVGAFRDCNDLLADGCEADTQSDRAHCGGCGIACGLYADCNDGVCDRVVQVEAGLLHACATLSTGQVACWGGARRGQLGNFSTATQEVPTLVLGLTDALSVDSLAQFSCALNERGVDCWGGNETGQNGSGLTAYREPLPYFVFNALGGGELLGVTAGYFHACAWGLREDIMTGDQVPAARCWGSDFRGELARGGDTTFCDGTVCAPADVPGLAVVEAAAGRGFTCFRTADRTYCAGAGTTGQLGSGTGFAADSNVPVEVVASSGFLQLAAGDFHACARTATGVQCWGSGLFLQNGDATGMNTDTPRPVTNTDGSEVDLCSGGDHSCALRDDGTVWCWGQGDDGQLGGGVTESARADAEPVMGLGGVAQLACGGRFTCALTTDAEVYCWGNNNVGQLGSTAAPGVVAVPTRIPEL